MRKLTQNSTLPIAYDTPSEAEVLPIAYDTPSEAEVLPIAYCLLPNQ